MDTTFWTSGQRTAWSQAKGLRELFIQMYNNKHRERMIIDIDSYNNKLRELFTDNVQTIIRSNIVQNQAQLSSSINKILESKFGAENMPANPISKTVDSGLKEAFFRFFHDGNFRNEILKGVGVSTAKTAISTLITVLVATISYVFGKGLSFLKDTSLSMSKRIVKFVAGLAVVVVTHGVASAIVFWIAEVVMLVLNHYQTLLGSSLHCISSSAVIPGLGFIVSLVICFYKLVRGHMNLKQFGEQLGLNFMQAFFFFVLNMLLNILLPGWGMLISIAVSFVFCGIFANLEYLRSDREQTYCEIIWSVLFQKQNDISYAPQEFLCSIGHEFMVDPAVLNGHFYEYNQILKWVNERGTDPFTREIVSVNDIIKCKEMKDLCYKFKYY